MTSQDMHMAAKIAAIAMRMQEKKRKANEAFKDKKSKRNKTHISLDMIMDRSLIICMILIGAHLL